MGFQFTCNLPLRSQLQAGGAEVELNDCDPSCVRLEFGKLERCCLLARWLSTSNTEVNLPRNTVYLFLYCMYICALYIKVRRFCPQGQFSPVGGDITLKMHVLTATKTQVHVDCSWPEILKSIMI